VTANDLGSAGEAPAVYVFGGILSEPTPTKREPSLVLVCMFCETQKSLKRQQGTHLCNQVQKNLLTRHRGGGNPFLYSVTR
jgi:hypothetical protein